MTSVHLTHRERQVIQGILDGLKNKEIGARLGLCESTIKIYLSRIYSKVRVTDRFKLAQWGREYLEGQRLVVEKLRAANPDLPPVRIGFDAPPITSYEGLRALLQAEEIDAAQFKELAGILLAKSNGVAMPSA